jgi:hypothetical protein
MTLRRAKSLQQRRKHIEQHHLAPRSNPTTNHVNTEPILTCRDLPFFPTTTRTRALTQIKQTCTRLPTIIPKPTAQAKGNPLSTAIQALDKQRKKKEPAHLTQTTSPGAGEHEARGKSPNTRAANQHPTISNPKIPTIQIPHVLTHRI